MVDEIFKFLISKLNFPRADVPNLKVQARFWRAAALVRESLTLLGSLWLLVWDMNLISSLVQSPVITLNHLYSAIAGGKPISFVEERKFSTSSRVSAMPIG